MERLAGLGLRGGSCLSSYAGPPGWALGAGAPCGWGAEGERAACRAAAPPARAPGPGEELCLWGSAVPSGLPVKRPLVFSASAVRPLDGRKSAESLKSSWSGRQPGFWAEMEANGDGLKGLSRACLGLGRAALCCAEEGRACGSGAAAARTPVERSGWLRRKGNGSILAKHCLRGLRLS